MFQTTNQNMMHMFDVYFFQMWTSRLVGAAQRSSVLCPIPWCRCLVILLEDIGQALVAEVEHTWTRVKFTGNQWELRGKCMFPVDFGFCTLTQVLPECLDVVCNTGEKS